MSKCKLCGKHIQQESFVVIENEEFAKLPPASFYTNIKRRETIEEFINNTSPSDLESSSDFPFCPKCTEFLLQELDVRIKREEKERDTYYKFITDNSNENHNEDEIKREEKQLQNEIDKLLAEEEKLKQTLKDMETSLQQAKQNLLQQRLESEKLDKQLLQGRYAFAEIEYGNYELVDANKAMRQKNEYTVNELSRLEKRNVYQDTFFINTETKIATINGFRFGRLPEEKVEWEELNAAWGEVVLLLFIIAKKLKFEFSQYRLRPLGSRSTIESLSHKDQQYTLYGSEDCGFTSWIWSFAMSSSAKVAASFDEGMVAFLSCLSEVCYYAQTTSAQIPYEINKDKIGSRSIRMQSNTEPTWTKALRNVLMNLNYLLAYVSSAAH